MKTLFLALGFVVALAPQTTPKGRPGADATTLTGRPTDAVTVTLVRWPFT